MTIKTRTFFRHPKYHHTRDGAPVNDVAIIKLDQATCLIDQIDFACLAPPSYPLNGGERCWAAGWGEIDNFGRGSSLVLNEVNNNIDHRNFDFHFCV